MPRHDALAPSSGVHPSPPSMGLTGSLQIGTAESREIILSTTHRLGQIRCISGRLGSKVRENPGGNGSCPRDSAVSDSADVSWVGGGRDGLFITVAKGYCMLHGGAVQAQR